MNIFVLSISEKENLQKLIDNNMLSKKIIQPSTLEYSSAIIVY